MALIYGLAIGTVTSLVGAVISYFFAVRSGKEASHVPLYTMYTLSGLLSVVGIVVIGVTLITGDSIANALLTGVGVVMGFVIAFAIMLGGSLAFSQFEGDMGD